MEGEKTRAEKHRIIFLPSATPYPSDFYRSVADPAHAAVLATMCAKWFAFTLRSFESTLARLRKERREQTEHQETARYATRA